MESKMTVVLGASTNPTRYAYLAANRLLEKTHKIVLVGIKKGEIAGHKIHNDLPLIENVDTVTLYIGADKQVEYYDYILSLNPKRVIFNPGTENEELVNLLTKNGIEMVKACTLVMLAANTY